MKYRKPTAALLAALLLAGCQGAAPGTPAASQAAPTEVPTTAPTAEPTAAPEPGLAYDEMRSIAVWGSTPATMMTGYFTVSKDDKWGLIKADGTELLPCMADTPVRNCGIHWLWWSDSIVPVDPADHDYDGALIASGEEGLCPGHGGGSEFFFYDLDYPGRDTTALDERAIAAYVASDGPGNILPVSDDQWTKYGDPLPVFPAHEEGESGDPRYPGDPEGDYFYITRGGVGSKNIEGATNASWFFDQKIAPVEVGDKWLYVDAGGERKTETVYSPIYATGRDSETGADLPDPILAAYLQNGYAAVCRDGKWGLLDDTGNECIPCTYDGAAWDGTVLWLKDAAGWHRSDPKNHIE